VLQQLELHFLLLLRQLLRQLLLQPQTASVGLMVLLTQPVPSSAAAQLHAQLLSSSCLQHPPQHTNQTQLT
jgi:hypothetical protein